MKAVFVLIVTMCLFAIPSASAQTDGGIHADQVDGLIYHFTLPYVLNATDYRWTFGDGASSTEPEPVHEYAVRDLYTIRVEAETGNGTLYYERPLELRELLDTETGNMNVGDISVPGGFLLVSCSLMFMLAQSGGHPIAQLLGKGGKDIVKFFYFLGIMAGGYLLFTSLYPGVGA